MNDPIADFLTRIRNAQQANHRWTDIPSSNLKLRMALLLKLEGFIKDFVIIEDDKQNMLRVYLKYTAKGSPVIAGLTRISRPGRRHYVPADNLPRVRNGLGIAILTTSRGVITDKQAKKAGVAGYADRVKRAGQGKGVYDGERTVGGGPAKRKGAAGALGDMERKMGESVLSDTKSGLAKTEIGFLRFSKKIFTRSCAPTGKT